MKRIAKTNGIVTVGLKVGDLLCRRNVVLVILFSWLLLFYVFSTGYQQNGFLETSKSTQDVHQESVDLIQSHQYQQKNSDNRNVWVSPAPFWILSTPGADNQTVDLGSDSGMDPSLNSIQSVSKSLATSTLPDITTTSQPDIKEMKKILYFTSYFHMKDFQFGFGQQPFIDHKCPVNNCFATNNRSLLENLEDFDAIMFHIRDMENGKIPVPNQKRRKENQRYVMFLMESPLNDDFPYETFKDFFNWTMTYRWDSDFVRPYSWIEPATSNSSRAPSTLQPFSLTYPIGNLSAISSLAEAMKTRDTSGHLISWMVSNCGTHSERESFVEQLQQFVAVDVYGGCGPFECSKSNEEGCMKMLETKYKFYLSFENSFCEDYVTEKFFKVLNYNMIPIVLGGGNYSKMAPEKSFVEARNFKSIAHLAEYIQYLDKNDTAYAEYFEWKKYFNVVGENGQAFCQLCSALNEPKQVSKTYTDLYKWWRTQARCIKKGRFPWSKTELEHYVDYFKSGASQLFNLIGKSQSGL